MSDFGAGKKVSFELANLCKEGEAELHVQSPVQLVRNMLQSSKTED